MENSGGEVFYKIPIETINPFFGQELAGTSYLLGSPGSGKTMFMKRVRDETGGTLVIESGIFDLFQRAVIDYVERRRKGGYSSKISHPFIERGGKEILDPDFKFPAIDGLNIYKCRGNTIPLDMTLDEYYRSYPDKMPRNLPYDGVGAYHYRECLSGRISSGGKSGFPDWLFIPKGSGYTQIISFPGHCSISEAKENHSIPEIPEADSALFLVDPLIDVYRQMDGGKGEYANPPLYRAPLHLADTMHIESCGIPVYWFLSKTTAGNLEGNRERAIELHYSRRYEPGHDLIEIVDRIPSLPGFDSRESPTEDIMNILKLLQGEYPF